MPDEVVISDGSIDFSGGVSSLQTPTVTSGENPNGLERNQLAWLVNGTVRDGGITQRGTWQQKGVISAAGGLWQGSVFGQPDTTAANPKPFKITMISGHVIWTDPDFSSDPVDLSEAYGLYMPANQPKAYFCQAENYLIIQSGDNQTLPLFLDCNTLILTRSNGITGSTVQGQAGAQFYAIPTPAWVTPAVGQTTAYINIGGIYPGNLYDNVSVANHLGVLVGTFRVTSITPTSFALLVLTLSGAPGTQAADTYTFTDILPASTSATVALSAGAWTVPAPGDQVTIQLQSRYIGSVGDTITIKTADAVTNYGSFKVISFTVSGLLRIQTVSTTYSGQSLYNGEYQMTVTAARGGYYNVTAINPRWPTIPPIGQSVTYYGSYLAVSASPIVGDIISVNNSDSSGDVTGYFRLTGFAPGASGFATFTLLNIGCLFYGELLQGTFVCTVSVPPTLPQYGYTPVQNTTINTVPWTVPPAGATVSLDLFWNYSGGNPDWYPGSVGDSVTLPGGLGNWTVVQFSPAGNITLQNVTGPVGMVVTGPVVGTLTINSAPGLANSGINQLPAATAMGYYMGRVFYANGDLINGGDIVGGPSGTSAANFRDAVLSVTENPLVLGGDGFKLPTQSGDITAFAVSNNVDEDLGQGLLFAFTLRAAYAMTVPISRTDWIAANSSNQPQIVQVMFRDGAVNDWSITLVNGDVFFQTWQPAIQSLIQATRYFGEWANVPISTNIQRILNFENVTLMGTASGVLFNNRMYQAVLPAATPAGTIFQAVAPLDFAPISTLQGQDPPNWEGHAEGLQWLMLLEQGFGNLDRMFGVVLSTAMPGQIELWEYSDYGQFENGDNRVTWQIEFPAFEFHNILQLKELIGGEIWVDRLFGTVEFKMEWRPDSESCWSPWAEWQECVARNSAENPGSPVSYPVQYQEGFRQTMELPAPQPSCNSSTGRPSTMGFQFQPRLTITGFCRVRGMWLHANPRKRSLYDSLVKMITNFTKGLLNW